MNLKYDEEMLLEVGRTHRTFGLITDYGKQVEIYRGPINQDFCYWLDFFIDTGWLRDCTWATTETVRPNGWKKTVTVATDPDGEEIFCVAISVKNKIERLKVEPKPVLVSAGKAFILGVVAGLLPFRTVLEILGLGFLLNSVKKS